MKRLAGLLCGLLMVEAGCAALGDQDKLAPLPREQPAPSAPPQPHEQPAPSTPPAPPAAEPPVVAAEPALPAPIRVFLSPFGHAIVAEPLLYHEPSVLGRDLNYWVLGDGPTTIFMLGGMHGDEVSSSEVVYDFLAHVLRYPDALASLRVVVVPEVNPDGLAALTRCNERGVDINRNFPASNWDAKSRLVINAPGEYPESEPETRFVLDLLERYPPDCVVVTHAAAACVNWDGPAKPLARALSLESRLPMRSSLGYATPGSLGNYLGADRAVPTITLELAHKEPNEKTRERRTLLKVLELAPPPRASLVE